MADFAVNIVLKARDENSVATIRSIAREYQRAFGQMGRMSGRGRGGGLAVPAPGGVLAPRGGRVGGAGRGGEADPFGFGAMGMHRYAEALGGAAANVQRFTELNKKALLAPLEVSMEFEHQMKRVKAMTDDAMQGDNFTRLMDEARRLGRDTEFTATSAAEGMEFLATAGFTTNQQIAAMAPLLDAASASGTELADMAEFMTDTMASFGLKTNDTAKMLDNSTMAMDSMVATTLLTSTNMRQLFEGIRKVGPIANTLGVDIHEVNAMLGVLSESGIKGAEGGTALRNMMLSVAGKPSADMRKMLKHMGIGTKQLRAELGQNGIEGAMRLLMERMQKLSPELQVFAANVLFERRTAAPALTILQKLDSSYADLETRLRDSGGTAKRTADEMRTSTKMGVEQLKGSIEDLSITIGDQFAPLFVPLMKDAEKLVEQFAAWAKENPDLVQGLAKASMGIVAFGTVVAPTMLGMSAFVSTLAHAKTLLTLLGPAAAGAAPGLVSAGGAAAGAGAGVATLSAGTFAMVGIAAAAGVAFGMWADETFKLSDALAGVNRERAKIAMTSGGQVDTRTGMVPIDQMTDEEKADLNVAVGKRISLRQQMEDFESTFSFGGTEGPMGLFGRDKRDVLTERMNEQSEAIAQIHARARARQRQQGEAHQSRLAVAGPFFGETPTGPLRESSFSMVDEAASNERFAKGATRVLEASSNRGVEGLLTQIRDELRGGSRVEVRVSDKKGVAVERGVRSGVSPSGGVS